MKILQRYIFRELILPFILCLLTLSFIFMAGYLVRAANFIIGRGVPFSDTLYILLLVLPGLVSYTVPMSLLTAVLIVFGGLSQNNEIRAVKASGIHPYMIMKPALLIGLAASFAMFAFNDQIATNAAFLWRKATKQVLIKHPRAMIEPGRFVPLSDSIIFFTKEITGDEMRTVVAYEISESDEKPIRTINAERGEIVTHGNRELQIRLYDGSVSDAKDASVQSIQFKTYEFPTFGQEDIRRMRKKTRDYTLAELLMHLSDRETTKEKRRDIWAAFNERIAFAFGSFIFVFVGIPIAILVHRGEIVLSFAVSLAAAGLYYILFVGAKTAAMTTFLPVTLVFWVPNVLLLALGARLLRRSVAA